MTNQIETPTKAKRIGRPELPQREKEKTITTKLAVSRELIEAEFDSLLGLSKEDRLTERGVEILQNAELRLDFAKEIELLNDELRGLEAQSDADSEEKRKFKLAKKEILSNELEKMPPLGYTQAMWDSIDPSMIEKSIGRPKLPIEFKLNRIRLEFNYQLSILNRYEKADGLELSTYESLLEEHNLKQSQKGEKAQTPGRPRNSQFDILTRDLKKLNSKIQHIESGAAQAEQEAKLKNASINQNGKRSGRPMLNLSKKLAELKMERHNLNHKLESLYGVEWHKNLAPAVAEATITTETKANEQAVEPVVAQADNQQQMSAAALEELSLERLKKIREESRARRQAAVMAQANSKPHEVYQEIGDNTGQAAIELAEKDEESEFNELISFLDKGESNASRKAS